MKIQHLRTPWPKKTPPINSFPPTQLSYPHPSIAFVYIHLLITPFPTIKPQNTIVAPTSQPLLTHSIALSPFDSIGPKDLNL
jgi:hypothetical protein